MRKGSDVNYIGSFLCVVCCVRRGGTPPYVVCCVVWCMHYMYVCCVLCVFCSCSSFKHNTQQPVLFHFLDYLSSFFFFFFCCSCCCFCCCCCFLLLIFLIYVKRVVNIICIIIKLYLISAVLDNTQHTTQCLGYLNTRRTCMRENTQLQML